jgi:hypothetical protein
MTTTINAAGGDYQGLPTTPVRHRGRKQHTGLDWDALTDNYTARGGQVDASVWPKANGKVVIVGGTANSSKANIHTFTETDEYDEPQATKPARPKRTGNHPQAKLTLEQRPEIARRYRDGESLTVLAKAYGVAVTTIRNTLEREGVETRRAGRPS